MRERSGLPVPQLAHVVVALDAAQVGAALPAQEDVGRRLHHPLAADDPLPVGRVFAPAQVGLEHRRLGLLGLEHDGVLSAAADQQDHPGPGADAADAHHLAGHVGHLVGADEVLAIRMQAVDVLLQQPPHVGAAFVRARVVELVQWCQQRRHARESQLPVEHLGQLPDGPGAGLSLPLLEGADEELVAVRVELGAEPGGQLVGVEALVPGVEEALACELAHPFAVLAHRPLDDQPSPAGRQVDVAAGDLDAGGHPLDVPLPGAGQRLVEVVGAEHEPAIGSREPAEVRDVRIAAGLDDKARAGGVGQVGRHHRGRAAEERERCGQHPPIPDRHQLGHPRRRLTVKRLHRVGPRARRRPVGVACTWRPGPRLAAALGVLAVFEAGDTIRWTGHS
jgi:hypothetical protein